jgi:fumarate hydratase subunit alpha
MRSEEVVEATVQVLREAETSLPPWVVRLIEQAADMETNQVARSQLQFILQNINVARSEGLPMCQDTGLLVFKLEKGRGLDNLDFDLREAIAEGVRKATLEIPLRPNVVDPLSRKNTGDNTGEMIPDLIFDEMEGDGLRITAFPKGAGSENMSMIGMLNPADDPFDFILQRVAERAANACPPLFLGIGIGGTFDLAARLAKRALLKMPGSSKQELELLGRINSLGIGPMGLGGDTTALGVKIETASCHTASLPVAINFQCWAHRFASVVVM